MKNEDLNIIIIKKKLCYIKKQEIKVQILKSIVRNKKLSPVLRIYSNKLLEKRNLSLYQYKHICLKHNKNSSVSNKFFFSKFAIKKYAMFNNLQNVKIDSW